MNQNRQGLSVEKAAIRGAKPRRHAREGAIFSNLVVGKNGTHLAEREEYFGGGEDATVALCASKGVGSLWRQCLLVIV